MRAPIARVRAHHPHLALGQAARLATAARPECQSCRCRAARRRGAAGRFFGREADAWRQRRRQRRRRGGCARWSRRPDTRRRARAARSSRRRVDSSSRLLPMADSSSVRFCLRRSWNSMRLSSRLRTRNSTSIEVERLGDEILGAARERLLAASRRAIAGHHQHRQALVVDQRRQHLEHPEAVAVRHVQVGDHQVGRRRRRAAAAARAASVSAGDAT